MMQSLDFTLADTTACLTAQVSPQVSVEDSSGEKINSTILLSMSHRSCWRLCSDCVVTVDRILETVGDVRSWVQDHTPTVCKTRASHSRYASSRCFHQHTPRESEGEGETDKQVQTRSSRSRRWQLRAPPRAHGRTEKEPGGYHMRKDGGHRHFGHRSAASAAAFHTTSPGFPSAICPTRLKLTSEPFFFSSWRKGSSLQARNILVEMQRDDSISSPLALARETVVNASIIEPLSTRPSWPPMQVVWLILITAAAHQRKCNNATGAERADPEAFAEVDARLSAAN